MKDASLHAFISRVSAAKRLNFGDLRRLQRDILPDGPQSREEVEALIALDTALERADAGWLPYLSGAVRDFVITTNSASGDVRNAAWLAAALSSATAKTGTMIAKAVAFAVEDTDSALKVLAKGGTRRAPKAAACSTGLTSRKITAPAPALRKGSPITFTWRGVRLGGPALTIGFTPPVNMLAPSNQAD